MSAMQGGLALNQASGEELDSRNALAQTAADATMFIKSTNTNDVISGGIHAHLLRLRGALVDIIGCRAGHILRVVHNAVLRAQRHVLRLVVASLCLVLHSVLQSCVAGVLMPH